MSLHLGNLSSRVRRDELERVFHRFGRCTVRVKDKFGFAVYDYPINAEKALKTLQGKKICGERITLSWSNRQPRSLQRYGRHGRTYEPPRGRHFAREDYANGKLDSDVQEGTRRSFRQAEGGGRRICSPDLIDGAKDHARKMEGYEGEKCDDFLQDPTDDEGGGLDTDLLGNERWGNKVVANELEKGMDFDRYEPDRDDYKMEEDIHNSPVRRSPNKPEVDQVKLVLEHSGDQKIQKSCYTCGGVGHSMQKCTRQLKRLGTRSKGRLRLDRDDSSTRQHKTDKEASTSRNRQGPLSFGDLSEERSTHRGTERDYHENKRSRKEYETSERHQSENARFPVSLSIHSDYTASGSRSQSGSKSLPSGRNAIPSRSRSGSTSSHTRTKKIQSESISRSVSPTLLSLSLSLGQPAPSSPNKSQISQKDYFVKPSGLEVKEDSFGVENGSSGVSMKPEGGVNNSDSDRLDDTHNHYIRGNLCEIKESCHPQSNKIDQNARNSAPEILTEMKEFKSDELREDILIPTKDPELQASGKEIRMVHRNYGLQHFDEIEEDLPPDFYFGSARLWPWEIIYYRRLRKGPISKDNYARRLSQNEEFGIVDKYIRSSSGWGELTDGTP